MAKRYGYPLGIVAIAALLLGVALHASGGMIFFSTRDEFESQFVGGLDRFNFNSFASDTTLPVGIGNAINFGAFSVYQTSPPPSPFESIFDVSPFETVSSGGDTVSAAIDNTPYANIFLDEQTSVDFVFSSPVFGFGGDLRGLSNTPNFTVFAQGQQTSISQAINFSDPFFGVISTDPITRIQFRYSGDPGGSTNLAFDNATVSSVPEPASLLLWGIGATLLMGYGYVRWHNREPIQTVSEKNA